MKVRNGSSEGQTVDITVEEYFKTKQVVLDKPYLPCLDVGKPKRPNYLPIEVSTLSVIHFIPILVVLVSGCTQSPTCDFFFVQLANLISLQRYTKALSSQQRTMLVEKSRQKPQDRMRVVTDVGLLTSVEILQLTVFILLCC
jgi:eukaryotic translation initiation factor 2C